MTRDEAIKVLERAEGYIGIHYINGVEDPYINPCLLKAIDFAVAALREQEERRWIPVTERLPKLIPCRAGTAYSEAVNVLTSDRKVITAIWDGTGWIGPFRFWDADGEEITHWTPVLLPLPEPPKEDGNGET